jgi:hypothetical protein
MFQTLIASATVGAGGAASIDFASIPQTFTDLTLVLSARAELNTTTAPLAMRFNGLSTGIYSIRQLRGTGASALSNAVTNSSSFDGGDCIPGSSSTAQVFANVQYVIPNYTQTTDNKTIILEAVGEGNITSTVYQVISTGRSASNLAVSSISILTSGNWAQYSTAYLYGTLKGSGGATVS